MDRPDRQLRLSSYLLKKKHPDSSTSSPAFFSTCTSISTLFLSTLFFFFQFGSKGTPFLSLGIVRVFLHLVCIRFSTLFVSYLIPTQYATKGNWVLRSGDREKVFVRFLNSLPCSTVVSMELALQHKATNVCYDGIQREESLATHAVITMLKQLFLTTHQDILFTSFSLCRRSQPYTKWKISSVVRWKLSLWFICAYITCL